MESKKSNFEMVKAMFENLSPQEQETLTQKGPEGNFIPTIEEQEGGRTTRWDLFSRLLTERIVRLDGQVNGAMAAVAQASLQYLDAMDNKKPIRMIINSPGGSVLDGLAIYDTMREIEAPVHTQGYGLMASMGSLLLVAGDKRAAAKNSSVMIHQVSAGTQGTFTDMEISIENTERLYKQLVDIYVAHTGISEENVVKLLSRDNWLSPEDAKKLNIIDEIIPHRKPAPYEHMVNKGTTKLKRKTFNEESKELLQEIFDERSKKANDNKAAPANTVATPATKKGGPSTP